MSREDEASLSRRDELLLDRAFAGLDPAEAAELQGLLGDEDDDAFDRAAAAIDLGCFDEPLEPLPAALRAQIEASARAMFDRADAEPEALADAPDARDQQRVPSAVPADRSAASLPLAEVIPIDRPRSDRTRWIGWLAAAACLALAVASWLTRPAPQVQLPPIAPPVIAPPSPPRVPSATEQRAALLASGNGVVRVDWSATKDAAAAGASGDVVWSNAEQRGYMRFHGLAANDPGRSQFQLWIFDKSQDERFPVDGGVFDVDATTGDVIVPITAKIRVQKPTLFAVTVEKPGGVVVSKREHIVLTAAMSAG